MFSFVVSSTSPSPPIFHSRDNESYLKSQLLGSPIVQRICLNLATSNLSLSLPLSLSLYTWRKEASEETVEKENHQVNRLFP